MVNAILVEFIQTLKNCGGGIIIKNEDSDARIGCSAESYILSDRLSSRTLGGSTLGADKISRL